MSICLRSEGQPWSPSTNLHAKIYMNESTALVASMNLTEWSTKNSREICVRIDGRERAELDNYVKKLLEDGTLLPSATPSRTAPARSRASATPSRTAPARSRASATPSRTAPARSRASATPSRTAPAPSRAHATRGWCIRCKADIPFDDERPLCHKDFLSWNQIQGSPTTRSAIATVAARSRRRPSPSPSVILATRLRRTPRGLSPSLYAPSNDPCTADHPSRSTPPRARTYASGSAASKRIRSISARLSSPTISSLKRTAWPSSPRRASASSSTSTPASRALLRSRALRAAPRRESRA